ncbi:MAG: DNA polymerase III subunit alpha [Acetobacteraceae bacterium]|nr:DNA polymerase III subunit alpha [Acetobacteraceae bacterium]MSP29596.1 DNA polymerase III subunit alpha [Acetobacteraceae bacterium]
MSYTELQLASAFSFLRGASLAEELAATAAALGMAVIGITDRNTVAGVVRMHEAAKQSAIRLLPGAWLVFRDGTPDILCYPTDRATWGRLTRLLTVGKLRARHGETSPTAKDAARCFLDYADLAAHAEGQIFIMVPPRILTDAFATTVDAIGADFPRRIYLAATRYYRTDDATRLATLATLRIPMVATNDVLYHTPERRPLADVLTATRLGTSVDRAGLALQANAERTLKSPAEMARLFRAYPDALARTQEITAQCRFSLGELSYEYPDEPIPAGITPDDHLATLVWDGAAQRFPDGIPVKVRDLLAKELVMISQLAYARYFLTVHDIVRYARGKDILCQGRGSAANSAVCYCLGITAVNPTEIDLLFERFISAERREPPDIDVDFEHERREEVIQYIYQRYGRDHAGIAATVIHYRPKSAIRDVGKAMGLSEDVTAALATQAWHSGGDLWPDTRLHEIGLDPVSPTLRRTLTLARELVGFPRHLSQHVGGFVLTKTRLDETVPIGNAAMDQRSFIEWDKDDINALGIMKVDILALGMLTCIRKAFALIGMADLADIPRDDEATYDMLCRGDSIGVFQVESRAQINMLPRLKPRNFYDLTIEIAIVRPGPIQGDMVHPYLRRRQGIEAVHYPSPDPEHGPADELERVLGKTLGVPLFQEQAMRVAMEAARFTPKEANALRRSMATFRNMGTIHSFFDKMVGGMVARGYDRDFSERCFRQIEGFGTYGFPESHAASFALLVYASAWLKCHHPAAFACALLNSQPMGFYAPAQIVRDAREHGVSLRSVDITASAWDCTLETGATLRLGLRLINGFREEWAATITEQRPRNFTDLARLPMPRAALLALAGADALRGLGLDRRTGLWQMRGIPNAPDLPLFALLPKTARDVILPVMADGEHVIADYRATGLSLKAHPLRFLRQTLASEGVLSCADATGKKPGALVSLAGVVLVRQRPGGGEVVFITLEDETGIANIVVWSSLLETYRRAVVGSKILAVRGHVQRSAEGVVHIIATHLENRSAMLDQIALSAAPVRAEAAPHPRNQRIVPRSRDFH